MTKFEKILTSSNESIKEQRAKIILGKAQDAQEEILRKLKKEKREIDEKLLSLTDIYPDSALSLAAVRSDFDAEELFEEIQSLKVDGLNKEIEVQVAEETYNEWFSDGEE